MSILFTGDLQADFHNLDLCDEAWTEIINISNDRDVDTIVLLGDLTQFYNPVDSRVIIWWQNKIRDAVRRGITVIINKGNHDRIGQFAESGSKLPLYKRAGAITFDAPGTYSTEIGTLYLIPYMAVNETRVVARKLQKNANKTRDILCFHQDISGTYYNRQGSKSDGKLTTEDLFHDRFRFCVGGHVHLPQRFSENCYYVGSPFCQDWGEVNQQKRYLVISKDAIKSVDSNIPRWYDPNVDGFNRCAPDSWKSSRIRITVPCDASKNYGRRLDKARRSASAKYRGAEIYVVPAFSRNREEAKVKLRSTDSDERKIREYIRQSETGSRGRQELQRILDYMLKTLMKVSGRLRQQLSINFQSIRAENFLSYKKLYLNLREKGLVLIQGRNTDRGDKSNGAGKTSLVQPIPVALFGKTFKDQKHDSWANRFVDKEPARVHLKFENAEEKVVEVIRGRRPPLLKMEVNGRDISSGMKSNDRDGTQQQIEVTTGFTLQTLANAVYIDRTISDAFLSGTKKSRTDVLARFQNLERFESALQLVRQDIKENELDTGKIKDKLAEIRGAIKHKKESIVSLERVNHDQVSKAKRDYLSAEKRVHDFTQSTKSRIRKLRRQSNNIESEGTRLRRKRMLVGEELVRNKHKLRAEKEIKSGTCPTCFQKVSSKWSKMLQEEYEQLRSRIEVLNEKLLKESRVLEVELTANEHKSDTNEEKLSKIERKTDSLRSTAQALYHQYKRLQKRNRKSDIITKVTVECNRLRKERSELRRKLIYYRSKSRRLDFVAEAFSRDGIPAFLNRLLCPVLNKAADYYADLFSDKEIQLQFVVEDGEFVPKVINAKGGESIDDQSTGERALAGLIASFALREVAPKSNLLILDEPGEGLDAQTSKKFARSLAELKERFGLILVCTHNVHIVSELNPDKILTVVKHNKISKLKEKV